MRRTLVARWQDWAGAGLQHLVLHEGPEDIVAEAVVIGAEEDGRRFAARFRIVCDGGWNTRQVEAGLIGAERPLLLVGDGAGHWRDGVGAPRPDLDGAIDVDLAITPFTNTLPIRRLGLRAGESADLKVVYIVLGDGAGPTAVIDPQRYTCLEPRRRYRYEALDIDFVREIEVDADGLVVTYPELFRRLRLP
jgi:uncharacterized protein